MTGPRLLLDEMMSAKIAAQLRDRGLDVQAVVERRELVSFPDEALLELATREQRSLVTKNIVDFGPLSQQWVADGRSHAGLVFISTKTFPETRDWIGAVTSALAHASEQGQLPGIGEVLWLSRSDSTGRPGLQIRRAQPHRTHGEVIGVRGGQAVAAAEPQPGTGRARSRRLGGVELVDPDVGAAPRTSSCLSAAAMESPTG